MTLLLTCVVIYMYTVIAFNFFRKFYREPGQEVYHCESMARVGMESRLVFECSVTSAGTILIFQYTYSISVSICLS